MLKETTVTERAEAWGRQRGFDLQVEAIELRDDDSRRALTDAQELYASAEARATIVIKQEEDLAARTRQVNQRAREVEELERQLLGREELDEITLRRELEALGTHESSLDRREAELDREREGLKDARVQILARELDADAREAGLKDQEARLAARERQMQELAVARKGLEDLQASHAGDAQRVWSFLGKADAVLASFSFSPVRTDGAAPEGGIAVPLLDSAAAKISQLEDAVGSRIKEEGRALAQAVAEHVLMCSRSRDPAISLEPVVQGPAEEPAEATAAGVEDTARAVADRFKREPEDS
jgi:DNA repair exonuclease SbcCD ATPase subunit